MIEDSAQPDTQTTVSKTQGPLPHESQVTLGKTKVSIRAIIALILTCTLCAVTFHDPDLFAESFKITVTGVIAYYFGQKTTTK